MTTSKIMMTSNVHTKYGVVVGLIKGKEIYVSRRIDTKAYPKKWQFVNGYLAMTDKSGEFSMDAAIRIVKEETNIELTRDRLHSLKNNIDLTDEIYYVYLVHLKDDETPQEQVIDLTKPMVHSEWKLMPLEKAVVLDLAPGLRHILRKLLKCLLKVHDEKKSDVARGFQERVLAPPVLTPPVLAPPVLAPPPVDGEANEWYSQ